MAFISFKEKYPIDSYIHLKQIVANENGYFEIGTKMKIIAVDKKGLTLTDDDGNTVENVNFECICFKKPIMKASETTAFEFIEPITIKLNAECLSCGMAIHSSDRYCSGCGREILRCNE